MSLANIIWDRIDCTYFLHWQNIETAIRWIVQSSIRHFHRKMMEGQTVCLIWACFVSESSSSPSYSSVSVCLWIFGCCFVWIFVFGLFNLCLTFIFFKSWHFQQQIVSSCLNCDCVNWQSQCIWWIHFIAIVRDCFLFISCCFSDLVFVELFLNRSKDHWTFRKRLNTFVSFDVMLGVRCIHSLGRLAAAPNFVSRIAALGSMIQVLFFISNMQLLFHASWRTGSARY